MGGARGIAGSAVEEPPPPGIVPWPLGAPVRPAAPAPACIGGVETLFLSDLAVCMPTPASFAATWLLPPVVIEAVQPTLPGVQVWLQIAPGWQVPVEADTVQPGVPGVQVWLQIDPGWQVPVVFAQF